MFRILLAVFLLTSITYMSYVEACPRCGNVEIPYPLSTRDGCGDSRYKIYCNNDVLEFMSAEGFYYRILSINPFASRLVLSPPLIQSHSCSSSDLGIGGIRLDDGSPFNISTRNTVMLFNCSANILLSPLNCSSNSFCRKFEALDVGSGCKDTLCCHYLKDSSMNSHKIRVRFGGCTAYTSVIDVRPNDPAEAWNYGIELQWEAPHL
ncbi:unnamed protein product [Linum trigynum]|uniref:Wall-associated receptor kinase galacturonan-binding domain-containing protein n=2 Tax=Linum trigynum TaxID=586398 RepID=A0AAV2F597_9ROSI